MRVLSILIHRYLFDLPNLIVYNEVNTCAKPCASS
jgi:hypothetical protein